MMMLSVVYTVHSIFDVGSRTLDTRDDVRREGGAIGWLAGWFVAV